MLILEVTPEVIELDDGSKIPYGMVVWSTGVAPRYDEQWYRYMCMCHATIFLYMYFFNLFMVNSFKEMCTLFSASYKEDMFFFCAYK